MSSDVRAAETPGVSRPIRVLYVTHVGSASGNAASLRLLIQSFPPGAVEAHVLTPPGDAVARFSQAGVRVHQIPGVAMVLSTAGVPLAGRRLAVLLRTAWQLRYGPRIVSTIRAIRPDIVHLNESGMFQAAKLARREGVPVVMHVRGVPDRETRWARRFLRAMTRRWVSRTVAIDESVRHGLADITDCEVVYNPLPVSLVGDASPVPAPGPMRVTFLNTLIGYKGIWDLLEAARRLRGRQDIVFQIVGGNSRPASFHASLAGQVSRALGLTRDVEREVADWVRQHGLAGTVSLLGRVERPDDVLRQTDVLVFPSHLNGPGRSVFEAGALGIPSIVTMRDRIEDIVEDGRTGLLVEERDAAGLASAIERLADDPALRRRLGAAAAAKYVAQFDPPRIGARMLALYRDVLTQQSVSR